MIGAGAGQARDDDEPEDDQDEHDDDPGEAGRAGDTEIVDGGQCEDRGHRDGFLPAGGRRVGGEGQRHCCATRRLADDETPTGEEARPFAQTFSAVDVGATGGRVLGGQLCRGRRVAVGDDRSDGETEKKPRPGGCGRRRERGEDACADHRSQADDDRVAESEFPDQ